MRVSVVVLLSLLAALTTVSPLRADEGFTPVTDQGSTLQCWAVAIASRLDVSASRTHGQPLKLSPKYLVYAKIRAEVLALVYERKFELYDGILCEDCKMEQIYYEQGGILLDGIETVRTTGIVPELAYDGFPEEDEKLFREINQWIAIYAAQAETLDFKSPSVRKRIDAELVAFLDKYLGRPPEQFAFEGKRYTPREFFNTYLPDWRKAQAREIMFAPSLAEGTDSVQAFNGTAYTIYTTGTHSRLMSVISESLKAGEPVLLQYKAYEDYQTQAKGHIGFAIQGLPVVERTLARWNAPALMTHYVLAIGGEWSASTGELTRIRVKNTWGVSAEEGFGFHWIESDFLQWMEALEINDRLEPRLRTLGLIP